MCKSAPYIFTDGKLEHSAFEGGYFDADKMAMSDDLNNWTNMFIQTSAGASR